jgi:ribonuclease Y
MLWDLARPQTQELSNTRNTTMEASTVWIWTLALCGFAVLGGLLARIAARKLADDVVNTDDTEESIRRHGEKQRALILEEAQKAVKERYETQLAELDNRLEVEKKLYENFDKELNERQSGLDRHANGLGALQEELDQRQAAVQEQAGLKIQTLGLANQVTGQLSRALAGRLSLSFDDVLVQEREEVLSNARLESSRWLMDMGEQVKLDARRKAQAILRDIDARYKPGFVWPKVSFSVDVPSKDLLERHFDEESGLVRLLTDGTMTSVESVVHDDQSVGLRIAGGAGVDKEVIRLTLEEVVSRKQFRVEHVQGILARNRKKIEKLVARLGREAVTQLGIGPVHPEIEVLIGSLNYRTSHRQNQYYHSLEVATLAGMLADEVGVDPILARRSGILHDIGKALDYRIDGSHAVISGDYALKFGEDESVVDTVLSHHDDKIVETPHAYILKAADAMSGARPGARVDMEEGYQKRIDDIIEVVNSFRPAGVVDSAIMHAGREVHVFVDNRRVKERDIDPLALDIARKLESDVQFPGQIKVTVVRRLEVSAVA